jgi:hypothetical protein
VTELEVGGWVLPGNVRALFSWLSLFVSYDFDDSDWQAIEQALPHTDDKAEGGWYDYPLVGLPVLRVQVAQCVGADPVMVRVTGDMDAVLHARVDTLISVMADIGG